MLDQGDKHERNTDTATAESDYEKLLNHTVRTTNSASKSNQLCNSEDLEEEFFGNRKPGGANKTNGDGDDDSVRLSQNIVSASTPPMSPGKKILHVAASPGRYIKTTMREGSINSSIFSLVIICLGAGTLTIPYAFYSNGYLMGCVCIIAGAILSIFTGYLITYCSEKTGGSSYEEIALATYGKGWQKFTSICMIPTNMGFVVSYMVLFKSFAPYTFTLCGLKLPAWCDDSFTGQIFWAVIFTIICSIVSLPRKLSSLRFASFFSILLSFYVVLVIVFEALLDRGTSETVSAGFKAGHDKAQLSVTGIFSSLPLVIFSYMYQINVPAIYQELETKTLRQGKKVLFIGTAMAAVAYIAAGIFGYIAFADGSSEQQLEDIFSNNVLSAPYKTADGKTPVVIYISLFGMMVVVVFATPFCILPTKDSIEEVRNRKFTKNENIMWTLILNWISCAISCAFQSIKTPMTILGATTNSAIGFLLPICYYLKMERKTPKYTNMKIACYFVFGFICISSVIELVTLGFQIANGKA